MGYCGEGYCGDGLFGGYAVSVETTVPLNTLEIAGGAVLDKSTPIYTLTIGSSFVIASLPLPVLYIEGGAVLGVSIPKNTLAMSGYGGDVLNKIDSVWPLSTLEMLGGSNGYGNLVLNLSQLTIESGASLVGSVPVFVLAASGSTASTGRVDSILSLSTLNISSLAGTIGGLSLSLPINILDITGWLSTTGSLNLSTPFYTIEAKALAALVKAVIMNTDNFALSEYEQFDIDSVVQVGDTILLAGKDGLYVLSGDTDDGTAISANVRTILTDFDSPNLKTITDGYFAVRGNGGLDVATVFDDGSLSDTERITAESQIKNHKTDFSRGVRNRFAGLDIKNVLGSDFEIDEIGMMIEVGSRRVN